MKGKIRRQGNGKSIQDLKQKASRGPTKVLVPLDGSSNSFRGLKHAIKNAKMKNQKIIGLYVVQPVMEFAHVSMSGLMDFLRKDGKETLKKAQQQCESKNVQFTSKMLSGSPGEKIVEFTKKNDIEEIVIGCSNKGKLARTFFGSTANYVLHKTSIPTTIIK